MAHITDCPICGQSVVDIGVHPRCQIAFLSDLLYQVQVHIRDRPDQPLPDILCSTITKERFKPLSEFDRYPESRTHDSGIFVDPDSLTRLSQMVVGPGRVDPFDK